MFLGGGGHEQLLDKAFAAACSGPLVYWPFAMADHPEFSTCEAWLRRAFEPLGLDDINTWPSLGGRDLAELRGAAGLYIGGGNTYLLLFELQSHGALAAVRSLAAAGLPVYGASAGAAVLGSTIETIAHLDPNAVGI